jgi:hypothetical protein
VPGARARPLRRPRRAAWLAALLLAACGGPVWTPTGTLSGGPGERAHLVLEGTPHQQGRAQGELLRARIHAFHEAYQRALLAPDGNLLSPASRARRKELLGLLEPARRALPEAALQELEGIAEGSELPLATLLLSEMLTDLLRFQSPPGPLLEGELRVSPAAPDGLELRLSGPLAEVVRPHLLWITRPARGQRPAVTVLAWPGSLGGLLAARADGLALLAVETPLEVGRQALAGVPFDLSLRLAAERAADVLEAHALLARTTAHRVLLAGGPDLRAARTALCALAGEDLEPVQAPQGQDDARLPAPDARFERRADGTVWLLGPQGPALRVP